uniref:Uncharacterized protein n=1 Tax=Ackermannviridae sp. TaxID=2831612 RepID=A0A8S5VKP6_9CAUD|nr:MAG TPA: hypothetical protein [Ackermannviridae sp.]
MAKVSNREDALFNAYLSKYKNAQASTVSEGQSKTQAARQKGAAILNATDKTLPSLGDTYGSTLQNIVSGAKMENSLSSDLLNRNLSLAKAQYDYAGDMHTQMTAAKKYADEQAEKARKEAEEAAAKAQKEAERQAAAAAKAAAKASRRSSRRRKGSSNKSSSSAADSEEAAAALDALDKETTASGKKTAKAGGNYNANRSNADRNASARARYDGSKQEKADIKYRAQQKAERIAQMLKDKQAAANAGANKGKAVGKSSAEQKNAGNDAAQPAQSRAVTRGGKVIGSSYAAAGSAPSEAEAQAAKNKRNDYKSRQEDTAAALKKLQTDAGYRAELAAPGRKLTTAEVAAVNQYEKSTKNTGFRGLKRVFETAANKDGLSQEDYAKKTVAMNAELNQNSALRGKAQMNGAGQTAQAFTAGLYDSVPFLTKSVDKLTDIANATGAELPQLSNAIDGAKSYDPLAAAAGTLVGKGMQYKLFNTAMEGTPLAQTMGKAGNAVVGQAQKIPVLGDVLGAGAGDALGRILTDTTADLALDTLPTLVDDLSTYRDQQQAIANGETVDEALTPGRIAGNTAKNIAENVAMNALPEIGGAVMNWAKDKASRNLADAMPDKQAAEQLAQYKAAQSTDFNKELDNLQDLWNGEDAPKNAGELLQRRKQSLVDSWDAEDAANNGAITAARENLDAEDRAAVGAISDAKRLWRQNTNQPANPVVQNSTNDFSTAILQMQQPEQTTREINLDGKYIPDNLLDVPVDHINQKDYNSIINGGVRDEKVGGYVREPVSVGTDSLSGDTAEPGNVRDGLSGQSGEIGQGFAANGSERRIEGAGTQSVPSVEEWAAGITGKSRKSAYTRRIENLYSQLQSGASRESLADEAKDIALGIVKADSFAEPLDESSVILKDYLKNTEIKLDEQTAGELLSTSGLKNIQQYNIQNGTHFSLKSGLDYDVAIPEIYDSMGMANRTPDGNPADALLALVNQSKAGSLIDTNAQGAYTDYVRDRILQGPNGTPLGGDDFTDWLEVQGFDPDMPDYTRSVYDRVFNSDNDADALPIPAKADSREPVPGLNIVENANQTAGDTRWQNAARPLNGSESVPANAVGAESTQFDRREVANQDYANQRSMTSGLDEAHLENLKTENTHQVWTDAEAKKQAEDDISTYIQQAGGDESKGLDAAMQDLKSKEHWNKGDSATADEIRNRLKNQFAATEPGTPEYYTQKARYEAWNQKRSQVRSETAQTMQSFHGDASERANAAAKPITERWVKNNPAQDEKIKILSDELAKLKDELRERDIAEMEREAMQGVFGNGSNAAKGPAGDMNAEFDQMLKDAGVITDAPKTDTTAEFDAIAKRVKELCEKHKVNCSDDAAKDIAGRILNGDNAEQYYDKLIMQAAGISDLTLDEMEQVDTLYSKAATMGDSKERYALEQEAINIMAKHLPAKSWFERFDNIRYLAMLGNPTTHARNLIGNVLMGGMASAKDEVSAAMQLVLPREARTKALYTPREMVDAAGKYIDENAYQAVLKDSGRYDLAQGLTRAQKTYGDNAFGRAVQWMSDKNSDLLDKEDEIFLRAGVMRSLASNLTAKGYDASIFSRTDDEAKAIIGNALEQAIQDGKDMTFHADNALTKALGKISHLGDKNGSIGDKIAYCIGNGLLPFSKTPGNILKTSLEYTPVGGAAQAVWRGATHKGAAAVTDSLAKGVVGTALMGLGWWLADSGFVTGSLGDNKDYQTMLGKQEFSLNIPGKGSYSIDWAAPSVVPVMMGATMSAQNIDLSDLMENPEKYAGQIGDILANALDPVTQMSLLQSANNTFESIRYNNDDAFGAAGSIVGNTLTNYAQQFVPTVLSKAARTLDDTRRSTYGGGDTQSERNTSYLARSLQNKIPVLSQQNEPYIDQWGREKASLDGTDDTAGGMFLRGVYNFASPGYYSAENVTPVDEYLQGLYGDTNNSKVYPEKASSKITVDGEGYYMTPKEKTEYAKTSGQTAYDLIDELRQNSMFLQLPEDQQSALVQDAYTVAKTAGGVAAVGDGVSGVSAKEYEAYRDGGAEGFSQYVLMKNATDLARDEKRETSGNDGAKLDTVETWDTLYSQFGDDAVSNFVDSTDDGSAVHNIRDLAGDKAVTAYMQAYSAVAKTLDDDQTPDKFTVGYGMQRYGLSGDDFARAYLAAYYKKDKNGKYPEKGGTYADKAGAEIYQSYGADALRDWVNYRATIPDTNGNGKVDKGEAMARLNEMDLTNELRRAYLTKTNKQWKNPY